MTAADFEKRAKTLAYQIEMEVFYPPFWSPEIRKQVLQTISDFLWVTSSTPSAAVEVSDEELDVIARKEYPAWDLNAVTLTLLHKRKEDFKAGWRAAEKARK